MGYSIVEAGPKEDLCYQIPGSEEKESQVMDAVRQETTGLKSFWIGGPNDCFFLVNCAVDKLAESGVIEADSGPPTPGIVVERSLL